jgi:hypothetical protein
MKKLFVLVAIVGMGAYLAGCGGDEPKPGGMSGPPPGLPGAASPGLKSAKPADGDKDMDDKGGKDDGDKDDDAKKDDGDAKDEN